MQVPADVPGRNRRKGMDYEVDLLTGERVYKNAQLKKSTVRLGARAFDDRCFENLV